MKRKYYGPRAAWRRFEAAQELTVSATTEFVDTEGIVDNPSGGESGGALNTGGGTYNDLPWTP